jgi:hypothetical protein
VSVPYYSGTVLFLPREDLFVNAFLDWTSSAASSHNQMQANYDSLTDGTLNRLQERAIFSAAWHPAEVFPNIPNPPSPFRGVLADRVIVDVWNWGLPFARIAQNIEALADYGLTNVLAVVHIWQRDGYDNGLPAHGPANAALGGDTGLSNLVARSLRLGIPVALHENYADCYPNYERFRTSSVP